VPPQPVYQSAMLGGPVGGTARVPLQGLAVLLPAWADRWAPALERWLLVP